MLNLRRGVDLIDELRAHIGGIAKRALQLKEYPTTPFSSLTARSEHAVKKEPEAPNPVTQKEQATLDSMHSGMSRSRARIVDAHKRGRTTLGA